jgi:hypothetical protein
VTPQHKHVLAAELELAEGCDPRAPGGEVTRELCGHWEHDGPCRWPHHSGIDGSSFHTTFEAGEEEADDIAARIEKALRSDERWRVVRVWRP